MRFGAMRRLGTTLAGAAVAFLAEPDAIRGAVGPRRRFLMRPTSTGWPAP
jgi:hypothetical protein